jgi:hypothetical protein
MENDVPMMRRFLRETTALHLTMSWAAKYPLYTLSADLAKLPQIVRFL